MPWPTPEIPACHFIDLAQIVAKTSWLPDPKVVRKFPDPVFPTIRKKSDAQIGNPVADTNGSVIGMFDNNTAPKLAIGWTHGLAGSTKGWTIAHVWPSSEDVTSYTHLANLALVPEALSTTTDKQGPLTQYLQYHAWKNYKWRPSGTPQPNEPAGYSQIQWRYLKGLTEPKAKVRGNLLKTKDQKLIKLLQIMKTLIPFRYISQDSPETKANTDIASCAPNSSF